MSILVYKILTRTLIPLLITHKRLGFIIGLDAAIIITVQWAGVHTNQPKDPA